MFLREKEKGIMSLTVVFIIGFLGLGMLVTITIFALAGIKQNRNTYIGNQTFYAAESAAKEGIYQFIENGFEDADNFSVSVNDISETEISFEVGPSLMGWAYKDVEGRARNTNYRDDNYRKLKGALLLFPSAAAFDYAIYSEDNLSITGSAHITGDIFSNGITTCGGGTGCIIEGNVYSNGDDPDDTCNSHASSTEENVDIVPPPTIDPYYYGGIADCTSTLADVENDCLSILTTGVVFVDDPGASEVLNNVDLVGNLTIIGDDITLNGGAVITASNDYAALVVDGNLKILGGATITGIVYVSGNTTFGGGDTQIFGSLISKEGVIDLGGNVTITYQGSTGPPGGIDDSGDPQIISWQEE